MNLVNSSDINHHFIYNMDFISHWSTSGENRFSLSHLSPLMVLVNPPLSIYQHQD